MVRGLSQWTRTLSFPARVSPQKPTKESKFHVSPSASPTSPPSPINDNIDKAPIISDEVCSYMCSLQKIIFKMNTAFIYVHLNIPIHSSTDIVIYLI